jgi:hypothetical protein
MKGVRKLWQTLPQLSHCRVSTGRTGNWPSPVCRLDKIWEGRQRLVEPRVQQWKEPEVGPLLVQNNGGPGEDQIHQNGAKKFSVRVTRLLSLDKLPQWKQHC